MPRFTHPLSWRLNPTPNGPLRIAVRAEIAVEILNASGDWIELLCLVDTGASFPMMGTQLARSMDLAIPTTTNTLKLRTAEGVVDSLVRDGELTLRFPQMPERELALKWVFRDDQPAAVPAVLGLHNTIDLMSILFDGTKRPDGFMGCMEFMFPDD